MIKIVSHVQITQTSVPAVMPTQRILICIKMCVSMNAQLALLLLKAYALSVSFLALPVRTQPKLALVAILNHQKTFCLETCA